MKQIKTITYKQECTGVSVSCYIVKLLYLHSQLLEVREQVCVGIVWQNVYIQERQTLTCIKNLTPEDTYNI